MSDVRTSWSQRTHGPPIPRALLLLGALIPIAVAGAATARAVKTVADQMYVRRDSFALIRAADSARHQQDSETQRQLLVKMDSANLRLRQIQCGDRVNQGCR